MHADGTQEYYKRYKIIKNYLFFVVVVNRAREENRRQNHPTPTPPLRRGGDSELRLLHISDFLKCAHSINSAFYEGGLSMVTFRLQPRRN